MTPTSCPAFCQVPPRYLKQTPFNRKLTTASDLDLHQILQSCTLYRILPPGLILVQFRTHSCSRNRTGESNEPPNLYSNLSGSLALPETASILQEYDYSFRLCGPSCSTLLHTTSTSNYVIYKATKCCTSESLQN